MIEVMHPGFVLLIGALALPLFSSSLRNSIAVLLPLYAFYCLSLLAPGDYWQVHFFGQDVTLLRVDKLSKLFGYFFTLNAVASFVYGYYVKEARQHVSALAYVGGALGVVFAGDLVSLYFFWELMAVASTFLILARQTTKASSAGFRYILLHLFGGLVLLAGILMRIHATGTADFAGMEPAAYYNWFILAGMLINAGAPPLHGWLPDAYPEASILGAVFMSAYTTKTAVYALARGFPGWEFLLLIGSVMAIYGVVYALLENDIRRILAYSVMNQVGFMLCGIGVGGSLGLNGAAAHAVCCVLYTALLFMAAGSVMQFTGRSKCTELGGLYRFMPWTLGFGLVGAAAISSVPLFIGFICKPIIIQAVADAHLLWPWLALEIASAGVFLFAGLRFTFFTFFSEPKGRPASERPEGRERLGSMHLGMGLLALACLFLGVNSGALYHLLPFEMELQTMYKPAKVVLQLQLLAFTGLAFFVLRKLLRPVDALTVDLDIFYRKGGQAFYRVMDGLLNGLNSVCDQLFIRAFIPALARFFSRGPQWLALAFMSLAWLAAGAAPKDGKSKVFSTLESGTIPVGVTAALATLALFAVLLLALMQ